MSPAVEFVTIEKLGGCWQAVLWGNGLAKLATGAGVSAQAALQNAVGVLGRK